MTKSKSSASSTVFPWIFSIQLVDVAQSVNETGVAGAAVTVVLPFTKM